MSLPTYELAEVSDCLRFQNIRPEIRVRYSAYLRSSIQPSCKKKI